MQYTQTGLFAPVVGSDAGPAMLGTVSSASPVIIMYCRTLGIQENHRMMTFAAGRAHVRASKPRFEWRRHAHPWPSRCATLKLRKLLWCSCLNLCAVTAHILGLICRKLCTHLASRTPGRPVARQRLVHVRVLCGVVPCGVRCRCCWCRRWCCRCRDLYHGHDIICTRVNFVDHGWTWTFFRFKPRQHSNSRQS